ncbi:MAG: stalk domain-containing protein [Caldisericum exile]
MKRTFSLLITIALLFTSISFSTITKADTKPLYQVGLVGILPDDYIGAFTLHTANTYESDYKSDLSFPMQGMTFTPDGNLVVLDTSYGRVHVLDKNLYNILTFGDLGYGGGRLQYPADVAVDKDGNFYIADFFNNYFAKFDKNGKWIFNAGSEGSGNGQFNGPSGIAVDSLGNVYVSDQLNGRIEVFDTNGNFKTILQTDVVAPGGMCVDSSNNLYVVDMRSSVVFKLDGTGKTLLKFGSAGTNDGQFVYPFDVSVDKQGNIYVLDRGLGNKEHACVQKFDPNGKFLMKFGDNATKIPQPNGTFFTAGGFAVDDNGNVFVIDSGYFYSPGNPFGYPVGIRLTQFDSKGNFVSKIDFSEYAKGRLINPWAACEDSKGNIWVTSWTNFNDVGEVDIFTPDGKFIKSIKGISDKEPFKAIGGIASDHNGSIYVGLGDFIAKFDENFNFVAKIGAGKVSNVFGVAVDFSGNVWAASNGTQSIVGFKPDGTLLGQFAPAHAPVGLYIDKNGNFYITTTDDNKVYVYDSSQKLKGSFGGGGRGKGKFWVPYGIIVDNSGNIIVSDTENGRLQAFKGDTFDLIWSTEREFYEPAMLSFTKDGRILVADCFHNVVRILSFTAPELPKYDFTVRSSLSNVKAKAGDSFNFNIVIKNTGSSDDSYSLKVENHLPSSWTFVINTNNISVKSNEAVLLPVSVAVPLSAAPEEGGEVTLTFTSNGSTNLSKSITISIFTPEIPPVKVSFIGDKVPLGNTGTIDLSIDKAEDLYGLAITISYDNTKLKVSKVEPVFNLGANAVFLENHDKAGTIIVGYSLVGKVSGVSASGSLIRITFTGVSEGDTNIVPTDVTFYNSKLGIIRTESNPVTLSVYNPAPPTLTVDFENGTTVKDSSFYITGKTDPGCIVTINNTKVSVGSDGRFAYSIILREGANTITIVSTNKYGISSKLTRTVYLKTSTVITLQIGSSTFTVNGVPGTLDSPPVIKNSRTLVPIRAIVEAIGGSISWDGATRKVTIELGTTTIELWIGKPQAKVNGVTKWIDDTNHKVMPEIINGRTMLPLRFVAESLGAKVEWDGTTKTITITYPAP